MIREKKPTYEGMARDFAVMAHWGQMYGDKPYIVHLDDVANVARPYGELAVTVAYLHDILEDTKTTADELLRVFGAPVANAVLVLTDGSGNRRERKERSHAKLRASSGLPLIVKAADRLANMRTGVKLDMYVPEYPAFREAAFRPGLCDALWLEMDTIARYWEEHNEV